MDVIVATALLVTLAPLFVAIAFAIWSTSRGPILFRQIRSGLGQHPFGILKFRTMVTEAGHDRTVRQASRDDPRVTTVGRMLRRTSLDELPQLINVLRGEMSLVGPRPHALAHDEVYGRSIRDYAYRFAAKPGISGLAQVSGARGETRDLSDMKRRLAYDLAYIQGASLSTDVCIALRSLREVVASRHAY